MTRAKGSVVTQWKRFAGILYACLGSTIQQATKVVVAVDMSAVESVSMFDQK